ncbi:Peptidase family S41 [seawater metagenome]|uniref:Peptidase family S41 n=1 Tax=seawater metagenome TaxID=1561972 RepID=A0A5E8CHY1_9ZZZZ
MYSKIIKDINEYIKSQGLENYIKNWEELENCNFNNLEEFKKTLQKSLQKYHKHSFIINSNILDINETLENQRPPLFFWDKKNKIGRIVFYQYIMSANEILNQKSERLLIDITHYYLNYWINKDMKGLIIDLRSHTGGNFYPFTMAMTPILGRTTLFAWSKSKVKYDDKHWISFNKNMELENEQYYYSKELSFKKPIAVLLSKKTASAGEFSASIFYGRENVKFFGERSKGLFSVNDTVNINNELSFAIPSKLTTTIDGSFHEKEYLEVDLQTKSPVKDAKKWISLKKN